MPARIKRCVTPLMLAMGTLPLPALLAYGSHHPLLLAWPLLYLLAACLCVQLRGRLRLCTGVVLGVGMLVLGVAWLVYARLPVALALGLGYGALLLVTLPARETLAQAAVFGGAAVHGLAQAYLNLLEPQLRAEVYAPADLPLQVSLLIFLASALLTLNSFSLLSAMPDGKAVPASIRRRNRALTWLMLGAALLIALIPALGRLLETLWAWLRQVVSAVIRWIFSLYPAQSGAGGQQGGASMDMSSLGEAAPPSALAVWLEKAMLAVTAVLTVLIFLWALGKLWKKLCSLLRWLFQRLQSYAASATEDYVDEMQDTRTQGEERFSLGALRKRRMTAKELSALPPRERIRARYGLVRAKHPEWTASHTARETIDPASAGIYERARYSAHEITEQDAEQFMK